MDIWTTDISTYPAHYRYRARIFYPLFWIPSFYSLFYFLFPSISLTSSLLTRVFFPRFVTLVPPKDLDLEMGLKITPYSTCPLARLPSSVDQPSFLFLSSLLQLFPPFLRVEVFSFIYPAGYVSDCPYFYPFIFLSIIFILVFFHLTSIHLSIHLSSHHILHSSVYPVTYSSVYIPMYLSIHIHFKSSFPPSLRSSSTLPNTPSSSPPSHNPLILPSSSLSPPTTSALTSGSHHQPVSDSIQFPSSFSVSVLLVCQTLLPRVFCLYHFQKLSLFSSQFLV